jgi:hypothetical protein
MIASELKDRYSFRVTQTAKGIVYLEKFEVNGDDVDECLKEMQIKLPLALGVIDSVNKGIAPKETLG